MKNYNYPGILFFLLMICLNAANAQRSADSLSIEQILKEEVESWNRGDAVAYSKHFSEDGTFTNIRGMFFKGHQQFLLRHIDIFKGMFTKTVLQQNLVSLRFPSTDIAIAETITSIKGFMGNGAPPNVFVDPQGLLRTRLLQVFQKKSGVWKIIVYHNVDIKPDALPH